MHILEKYMTKNPCFKANVDVADDRYKTFQERGPLGLMLHSVGCAQPSAEVFWNRWNNETYYNACVHAFIDAQTGDIWQCMPWNYRAWHCGGSGNNTHVGVELCETKWISYYNSWQFTVIDRTKAVEECVRSYKSAVELFAQLCILYNLDPLTSICSHKEGHAKGIASDHGDPEHYWSGLGMNYTMNGFREAVKQEIQKQQSQIAVSDEHLTELIRNIVDPIIEEKLVLITTALSKSYSEELTRAVCQLSSDMNEHLGEYVHDACEIKSKHVRSEIQALLALQVINGGTPLEQNSHDVNMHYELLRVLAVSKRYSDMLAKAIEEKIAPISENTEGK